MRYAISFIPTEDTWCQCRVLKGLGLLWINSLFCHYNCTCILNYPKCGPSFHQPVNCALSQTWIKTDRHIICMNTLKHWQLRHIYNCRQSEKLQLDHFWTFFGSWNAIFAQFLRKSMYYNSFISILQNHIVKIFNFLQLVGQEITGTIYRLHMTS